MSLQNTYLGNCLLLTTKTTTLSTYARYLIGNLPNIGICNALSANGTTTLFYKTYDYLAIYSICIQRNVYQVHFIIYTIKMDIIFNKVQLPDAIKSMINAYLGGATYWEARKQLTVYKRKIDIFSSDWWKEWHSYLNCYQHDDTLTCRDMNDLINVTKMPSRFSWIFAEEDKEVALLMKLYKASVDNRTLLHMLNMNLDMMYYHWKSHVEYYKTIVF